MGVDFNLIREKQKQADAEAHRQAREETPVRWLLSMDNMVADIGRYNAEMAKADRVLKRIDAEIDTLIEEEK